MSEDVKFFVSSLLNQEIKKMEKIHHSKRKTAFDVAFCIRDSFQRWKKQFPKTDFPYFLREYLKQGDFQGKRTTLTLAYNVAEVFKDLKKVKNRRKSFECYRIIANAAGLSQTMREAIRDRLEEDDKYNSSDAKRWVNEELKKIGKDGGGGIDEAEITYINMSQFGRKFRKLFDPSENMKFLIIRIDSEDQAQEINRPVVSPQHSALDSLKK